MSTDKQDQDEVQEDGAPEREPRVLYRDAGTGQLVSAEYAAENPETTVREVR